MGQRPALFSPVWTFLLVGAQALEVRSSPFDTTLA